MPCPILVLIKSTSKTRHWFSRSTSCSSETLHVAAGGGTDIVRWCPIHDEVAVTEYVAFSPVYLSPHPHPSFRPPSISAWALSVPAAGKVEWWLSHCFSGIDWSFVPEKFPGSLFKRKIRGSHSRPIELNLLGGCWKPHLVILRTTCSCLVKFGHCYHNDGFWLVFYEISGSQTLAGIRLLAPVPRVSDEVGLGWSW